MELLFSSERGRILHHCHSDGASLFPPALPPPSQLAAAHGVSWPAPAAAQGRGSVAGAAGKSQGPGLEGRGRRPG